MKKLLTVLVALLMVCSFVGCTPTEQEPEETFEIAVVTDVGQLNDGGFNQGTYEGAVAFAKEAGKTYKYYQPANGADASDADRIAAMELAIEEGAKVIVTPGFMQENALKDVCPKHPDVKFVFVDGWNMGFANLTAICYKEQESGYFAGYAAVKDGYTKLGGVFGGGGTNPACNRYAYGYVQGANAAASELGIKVDTKISFNYGSSFSPSGELQTMVAGWYADGCEVVFSCGGGMVSSVLAAAKENNAKVIGVDVDQASLDECVITSAQKGLVASVKLVLEQWNKGEWDAKLSDKTSNLGAAEDATGIPTTAGSWRFTKFTAAEYNALFAKVADGTLVIDSKVADDMSAPEAWADIAKAMTSTSLTVIK